MTDPPFDVQRDWDADALANRWPDRLDHRFFLQRLHDMTLDVASAPGARRLLDVASGEASYTAAIAARGLRAVAIDPSAQMLGRARALIARSGAAVTLVRGIAETLPFRSASFDRVLCHSAIDHLSDPDLAVREMARVLAPSGRLILGLVNFPAASGRLSRLVYAACRALRLIDRETRRFWDSPVGIEHTFEGSVPVLERLCAPYFEIERRVGVSIGWGVPGWGALLERLPEAGARALLEWLDRRAARWPRLADFVYIVARPRPAGCWPRRRAPEEGGFAVQPDDVVYAHKAASEQRFWGMSSFAGTIVGCGPAFTGLANAAFTGDAGRAWLDDLIGRGPFRTAAVLGCDEVRYDAQWLARGGTARLDVYELSPAVIRRVRARLGAFRPQVRFIRADLNFAALPAAHYDVIWASGSLHHVVNLEWLYAQIAHALRPGGLFAFHEYIGERRMQHRAARLERLNALLREVPPRFRHNGIAALTPRNEGQMSPLCGVRSDDVLRVAESRFALIHKGVFDRLFPLLLFLDLDALARDEPALFARIAAAEAAAVGDDALPPCSAYAVFRKV